MTLSLKDTWVVKNDGSETIAFLIGTFINYINSSEFVATSHALPSSIWHQLFLWYKISKNGNWKTIWYLDVKLMLAWAYLWPIEYLDWLLMAMKTFEWKLQEIFYARWRISKRGNSLNHSVGTVVLKLGLTLCESPCQCKLKAKRFSELLSSWK